MADQTPNIAVGFVIHKLTSSVLKNGNPVGVLFFFLGKALVKLCPPLSLTHTCRERVCVGVSQPLIVFCCCCVLFIWSICCFWEQRQKRERMRGGNGGKTRTTNHWAKPCSLITCLASLQTGEQTMQTSKQTNKQASKQANMCMFEDQIYTTTCWCSSGRKARKRSDRWAISTFLTAWAWTHEESGHSWWRSDTYG